MMNFLNHFENSIASSVLIPKRSKLLIACSGGPDSVALFHLLRALQDRWAFKLALVHFDHNLRGSESKRDAAFVKRLAKKYGVPFYGGQSKVSRSAKRDRTSLEEAARHARYAFFCKTAAQKGIRRVVMAHTQDDQAETVLMRMLQGTGLRGLRGIQKQMKMKGITFIRPLLDFRKRDLLHYAKKEKLSFRTDKSNQSRRFLRNWLRLEIFPQLQRKMNPRVVESLSRIPLIVEEESGFLEALEKSAWKTAFKSKRAQKLSLRRQEFLSLGAPLQFRVLNRALHELDPRSGVNFDAWRRLRPYLGRKRYRCSFPRNLDFDLTPLKIDIYKKK